ncbi:MAG TPA: multicopper oxidase domain-containing protein [Geodermatophilus sp.]|nr:multicopper oxidase domain-containing protein [Geodermatophilus sp.]
MSAPSRIRTTPRRGRRILAWAVAVVVLVGAAAALAALAWSVAARTTAGQVDFSRPLAIPPLAESTIDADGRRVFDLRLQTGRTDFGLGRPTDTWGVNGPYLGPTLRAQRGEQVAVRVTNDVGESTTLHWHGMHLPPSMDGGPHQMIEPGGIWFPSWQVDQPAATLWYHPHLHGETAEHVYRGLAGMFLIDDPDAAPALPRNYGVDDLPVIVQDKSFTDDGQLDDGDPLFSPTGFLGDTILVNGTIGPYAEVTTETVRLRLLNASNARIYDFGLVDPDGRAHDFVLVGTDGGLLPAPVPGERVQLSPGERAEIVVSMTPGQDLVLRSFPPDLGGDFFSERFAGGDDTLDVLQLRAADTLAPSPALPHRLAPAPDLREEDAVTTRTFRLSGTAINGQDMDMNRIDEVVRLGTTELWEVTNADGIPHNFHVHDVQFQVVDVAGAAPPPELSGWKDTVYVAPGSVVRLIMRFTDYADPESPYMFHCHLLRHEDSGMMGQFVVVRPEDGVEPGSDPDVHASHGS